MILKLCSRFLTTQRKRQRQCRESRSKNIGRICKPCCAWFAPTMAANTLKSDNALLWIVAALNYLIDPFDLIPDATPVLGFVDDATVIEFVTDKTRQTLDDFMMWETAAV
jgi:uncharacterized membrane protein YkvA (DUF1232 family)